MQRRSLFKMLATAAAGLTLATTPESERAVRRFWQGYRADEYKSNLILPPSISRYGPWVAPLEPPSTIPWTERGITQDGLHFRMGYRIHDVSVDQKVDWGIWEEYVLDTLRESEPQESWMFYRIG